MTSVACPSPPASIFTNLETLATRPLPVHEPARKYPVDAYPPKLAAVPDHSPSPASFRRNHRVRRGASAQPAAQLHESFHVDVDHRGGEQGQHLRHHKSAHHRIPQRLAQFRPVPLKLLYEFLSDRGTIWIILDGNEAHRAKLMLDGIFGDGNNIGTLVWEKSDSPRMDAHTFSSSRDLIVAYAKGQLTIQADLRPARSELYRCGPPVHVSALSKGEDHRDAHKQDEGNAE
jgi:hypothetical protein